MPPQGTNALFMTGSSRLSPIVDGVNPWLLGNLVFTNTSGAVTVSGNTLRFLGAGIMMELRGGQSATVSNAVDITGGSREIRQMGSVGTVLTLVGPVWFSNNASFFARGAGILAIEGQITGNGSVSRTDDGIVKLLNPTNSFSGNISISHGWIEVATLGNKGVPSHAGAGTTIQLGQGTWGPSDRGTLRYIGATAATDRDFTLSANAATQTSATVPYSGRGTIEVTNSATTLTLNGNFLYAGLSSNGQWRLWGAGNGAIDGDIRTRGAALEKDGAGTWTINGGAGHTNITEVKQGRLTINGTHTNAGNYTVSAYARLGGSGVIWTLDGGGVTLSNNAVLEPGSSAGTLTITNGYLALSPTSILEYELNAADTTVGGGVNDLVRVFGALTLDGTLNITGPGDFTAAPFNSTWTLFEYTGSLTDNTIVLGTLPDPGTLRDWQVSTDSGNVRISIVPEPGTFLMTVVGLAALVLRRRR